MKSKKGFTLIELMVVILIVAILAAVAIPILRGRIDAAKWSEGKAIMGSIATSIRAWCAEQDPQALFASLTVPSALDDLGFQSGDCTGTYFIDTDFTFTITDQYPPTFTVDCDGGSQAGAPATPANGYVLSGNANGTMTWAEGT
jgi:type IV pilus assembly protein PilA